MRFSTIFLQILGAGLSLVQAALANNPRAGYVTLINATPYDWKLSYSHSYQMDWNFPVAVKAGTSHEQYIKFKKDNKDDGAEAFYYLENSPSPASFIVKARPPKHIEIQFQETLASLNNPEESTINVGFVEKGAVSFVLSGDTGSYISSNPPVTWMQATLSNIGSKSLREIAMPASHDAGMSEVSYNWSGVPHNTRTQTANIYHQLVNGARVFDIRPTYWKKEFYCGHFSRFGAGMVGGTGRKIWDVVNDINAFTNQYPGELIILDISHQMDATKNFRDLSAGKWKALFEELNRIQALWIPSSLDIGDDLSSLPLSTFITPGSKSAVLVRLPNNAPLPESDINPRSIDKRAVLATKSIARADHTDGMMPLGPALKVDDGDNVTRTDDTDGMMLLGPTLNGNDYDNATTTDGTSRPTPSTLPTDQQTQNGGDDDSSTPDDSPASIDIDAAIPMPSNLLSATTLFPLPSSLPTSPTPEPIPAAVPVPGTSRQTSEAFIHASRLPTTGSYSDTDNPSHLISDQLSKLSVLRPNPHSEPHKSVWTITQKNWIHITDVANRKTSITGLTVSAHRALLGHLWDGMIRGVSWPNMIEVDDVRDSSVAALCMAINDYFVDVEERLRSTPLARSMVKKRRWGLGEYWDRS